MNEQLTTSRAELDQATREWIQESIAFVRHHLELHPNTVAREILLIHVTRGQALLRDAVPSTSAADVVREAATWWDARNDALERTGRAREEAPDWLRWAYRLLPSVGLPRCARLTAQALEDNERDLDRRDRSQTRRSSWSTV
ncbi:MAG: hypothetical protein AB7T31_15010 [Gemmatimonadales bacterium]